MSASDFAHLAAILPVDDDAFEAYWQFYLQQRPDLVDGASIEIERAQLRTLLKLSFLAGRHAATREFAALGHS